MAALERCSFLWLFLSIIFNSEESRAPQDVKFISQNFHNVLHWKPGNGIENTTLFFVQHQSVISDGFKGIMKDDFFLNSRFGHEWANKTECWGIRVTCCDLTRETILLPELFFARVRAFSFNKFSNWTMIEPFCPMTDSKCISPKCKDVHNRAFCTILFVVVTRYNM
ncbi:interleukin-22 receptor subunit alpha-2-like [Amblyraja radiata]|uniref:interleukin-22 receptor subunit alpha-2-like n=1 Tax=Amblyraja radiata TaxID=386614 RepID=UPI0014036B55|nr:interleukin-22 receptor subunit alpha-2-like [Amblyraja radiata]